MNLLAAFEAQLHYHELILMAREATRKKEHCPERSDPYANWHGGSAQAKDLRCAQEVFSHWSLQMVIQLYVCCNPVVITF